ncbi:hypothetical protein HYW82_02160 [Candidatus Peregrinibacteria bacterium]|nr:hypothetical protein [Candidatus Peregrinibacteria bacterium]
MPKIRAKVWKTILQFFMVTALMLFFVHAMNVVNAGPLADKLIPDAARDIIGSSQIPSPPDNISGQEIVKLLIIRVLAYAKIIIGVIGILYLSILGYKLVTEGDNDETITTAKKGFVYTFVAFVIISMSGEFARIFDMTESTIFQNPQEMLKRFRLFDREVEVFVTFIKYAVGAYATLMLVRAGIKLVTTGGDDEERDKYKKSLMYNAGGLAVIAVGDIFINKVFYKINGNVYSGITGVHPQFDVVRGIEEIKGITNFVVSFVGPIAVLMLIVAAIMYATAGGEDERTEKAKRLLVSTIIGIFIIFGAFAIVNTVISGKLDAIGALT